MSTAWDNHDRMQIKPSHLYACLVGLALWALGIWYAVRLYL